MKSLILGICFSLFLVSLSESEVANCFAQGQPRKYDEFGNVTCEYEKVALDHFAKELQNNADAQGHIIVYGGRRGPRNQAKSRAARMRFYLVRIRGLDTKRIVTLDGGYRKELSNELWLVRTGEQAPSPTPTVSPRHVRLKGRVRVRGYNCDGPKG